MSTRVYIVITAMLIRLALLPGPGFPDDLHCFASWMHQLAIVGPRQLYEDNSNIHYPAVDYPPAYLYVLWCLGWIERTVFGPAPAELISRAIEKLPAVIADFVLAFTVTQLVGRYTNARYATVTLAFLLLSPVLWLVSAYWGQVDSIAALGLVLTLRAAIDKKFLLAWVLIVLTITIKPQPVVVVPLLFLYQMATGKRNYLLIAGPIAGLVAAYLIALPSAPSARPTQTLTWLVQRYSVGLDKYPNGSTGAFNLYTVVGKAFAPDSVSVLGVSLHTIGTFIAITLLVAIAFGLARRLELNSFQRINDVLFSRAVPVMPSREDQLASVALLQASALAIMALFLFLTRMHERYEMGAIVLLPFLAFVPSSSKRGASLEETAKLIRKTSGTGTAQISARFGDLLNRDSLIAALLAVDFVVNALCILAGFYGGHHHPAILLLVHAISLANILCFLILLVSFITDAARQTPRPAKALVRRFSTEASEV